MVDNSPKMVDNLLKSVDNFQNYVDNLTENVNNFLVSFSKHRSSRRFQHNPPPKHRSNRGFQRATKKLSTFSVKLST